jgi:hypothetical protein
MEKISPFRYTPEEIAGKRAYREDHPVPGSPWTDGDVDDICAVNLVPPETLVSFFKGCIDQLKDLKGGKVGDYLEFGVFNGSSIGSMHIAREQAAMSDEIRLFGFDAFEGLPEGSENEDGGVWKAGYYACSFDQTQACLEKRGIDPKDIHWVKGWYNETLTPSLTEEFNHKNLGVVFVDCDTYSSSKTVMDYIAPLVSAPVILCFDDWKLNDVDLMGEGEYRSFNEFLEENPHLIATEIESYNRKSRSFIVQPEGWVQPSVA